MAWSAVMNACKQQRSTTSIQVSAGGFPEWPIEKRDQTMSYTLSNNITYCLNTQTWKSFWYSTFWLTGFYDRRSEFRFLQTLRGLRLWKGNLISWAWPERGQKNFSAWMCSSVFFFPQRVQKLLLPWLFYLYSGVISNQQLSFYSDMKGKRGEKNIEWESNYFITDLSHRRRKNYKIMSDYAIIFMRVMMTNGRPKRGKKERKNLRFLFSSTVRKTFVRCSFFSCPVYKTFWTVNYIFCPEGL